MYIFRCLMGDWKLLHLIENHRLSVFFNLFCVQIPVSIISIYSCAIPLSCVYIPMNIYLTLSVEIGSWGSKR